MAIKRYLCCYCGRTYLILAGELYCCNARDWAEHPILIPRDPR